MITLDGKSLSYFGLSCEKQYNPLTPTFDLKSLHIPGAVGLYNFGTELKEKVFGFEVGAIERDKTLLQHKLSDFISFLLNEKGEPRPLKMVFDYDPDKYYTVALSEQINPERVLRTGKFKLQLTAHDPRAYSVAYADEITWGSTEITFLSHYKLGHTGSASTVQITTPTILDVLIDGLALKPVIEISGSASGLSLSVNGYTITLPTFSSASWIIDCEKYTVMKNGASAFSEVFLRDFILLPGSNQIQITGTGINVTMRIKARDKYN